jgi:hypothetical protein
MLGIVLGAELNCQVNCAVEVILNVSEQVIVIVEGTLPTKTPVLALSILQLGISNNRDIFFEETLRHSLTLLLLLRYLDVGLASVMHRA